MKKFFFLNISLYFLMCCTVRQKPLNQYLSTLENFKVFYPTLKEAIIIDSLEIESKKILEKCEREKLSCFVEMEICNES